MNRRTTPGTKRDCQCPQANHQHGTYKAYNHDRCRCDDCLAAKLEKQREVRRRNLYATYGAGESPLIDATGTQRRIKALQALGWSQRVIGQHLGISARAVGFIRDESTKVRADTAARISRVYEQLWDIRPAGHGPNMARTYAATRGWVPPLAWDDDTIDNPTAQPATDNNPDNTHDEIAVERIMRGDPPKPIRRADRLEAMRRLAALGYDAGQIGHRVGLNRDATWRALQRDKERRNAA